MFWMEIQIWGSDFNFGAHIFDTSMIYRAETTSCPKFADGLVQFCVSEVASNNIVTWDNLELIRSFDDQCFQLKCNLFAESYKHTFLGRINNCQQNKDR